MLIRYFKEYYLLRGRYQDITQTIAGVGLVGGILFFWYVVGPLMGKAIQPSASDPYQDYTSWKVAVLLLCLPASIWLVAIVTALAQALFKKITVSEALAFSCCFRYPHHWLKEKSDIEIRKEKIEEFDEKLKG